MQFEERRLKIVLEDGPEQGRVIEDSEGSLVRVVTKVDGEAFETAYLGVF